MRMRLALLVSLAGAAGLVGGDEGRVPRDVRTSRFATAVVCGVCHGNADDSGALRDVQGRGIAPYDLWRSTMKANAARDPFFLAAVAAEVAAAPGERVAIEAECLHCHAPMASVEARAAGRPGLALADLEETGDDGHDARASLARDGVSCTLCHQIAPEPGVGGAFRIGEGREIFGPHDKLLGKPMHRVTKYWPALGEHVLDASHCGTCHASKGDRPELASYFEWRNSSFRDTQTCQDCHLPTTAQGGAKIRTRISRTSHGGDILALEPREPVGRHLFVGGNTLLLRILRDHADELHVKAPPEAFDATIARTKEQLTGRTARVQIEEATRGGDELRIVVSVENLAGHKLPTEHPSRRAWLRLRVRDGEGRLVFASGEVDAQGRIAGLAAEAKGGPVAPHRKSITKADQVQIYETVRADAQGAPRFLSHGAVGVVKDNRLLPRGWSAEHEDAARTAPVGVGDDEDFTAGGDRVVYEIAFPEDRRIYDVEVALLYQPVSARFAAELFAVAHPEVERFRRLFLAADRAPVVLSRARLVGGDQ